MNPEKTLQDLQQKGIISPEQRGLITDYEKTKPFSLHYELRTLLYLGITFFTGGLGVLIYQNIDTIGHGVIVGLITLITLVCFGFTCWKRHPFTWEEVKNPAQFSDFALLLGCISFLILEGYLQFQYDLFGLKYGFVTIIPAILFFFCAYFFDHRGVLSMAITAFASWVGVSIAPLSVISQNNFSDSHFLLTAILLGVGLSTMGLFLEHQNRKKHFSFTYLLLGSNLALITCIIGFSSIDLTWILYIFVALILSIFLVFYARKTTSYVFLLMGTIYGYIALSFGLFQFFEKISSDSLAVFGMYYFLLSGVGVVLFLINIKKILGVGGK